MIARLRAHATLLVLIGLIAGGVLLRCGLRGLIDSPYPADASYYLHVAQNAAEGRGLVTDYAWCYARGVPEQLPTPAFSYWNPGASLYLLPWLKALGPSYLAAQIANIALSIPFALLVWAVTRRLAGSDAAALLAVALASVEPNLVLWSITADATMLHATLVAAGLLCTLKGLEDRPVWFAAAGALAGCAWLVRNDGILVLVAAVACLGIARIRRWQGVRVRHVLYIVLPCIAVMAPWLTRNTIVFGSPSPAHQAGLLFLPTYADLFRVDWCSLTPDEWLAHHGGWGGVLAYDLSHAAKMLGWVVLGAGNLCLLLAVPYLVKRRPTVALPFVVQFVLLTVAYGLVLPEIGHQGAFARSFPCLYPLLLGGAACGLVAAGEWLADRAKVVGRPAVVLVLGALLMAQTADRMGEWVGSRAVVVATRPYEANQNQLRAFFFTRPDGPVVTDDPWTLYRVTGRSCYHVPTGEFEVVANLAQGTGARYLVITGTGAARYPDLTLGNSTVVRRLATEEQYGDLFIVEPAVVEWASAARLLTESGIDSAKEGDALAQDSARAQGRESYRRAEIFFNKALARVAEESEAWKVITENLATVRAKLDALSDPPPGDTQQ